MMNKTKQHKTKTIQRNGKHTKQKQILLLIVMMMRIPNGVPISEQIISLLILYLTVIFIIWIAAKIYRIGILMYGKKPSYKDLIKWLKY